MAWASHERALLLAIKWARVDIAKEILHAISHLGGATFETRYHAVNLSALQHALELRRVEVVRLLLNANESAVGGIILCRLFKCEDEYSFLARNRSLQARAPHTHDAVLRRRLPTPLAPHRCRTPSTGART